MSSDSNPDAVKQDEQKFREVLVAIVGLAVLLTARMITEGEFILYLREAASHD